MTTLREGRPQREGEEDCQNDEATSRLFWLHDEISRLMRERRQLMRRLGIFEE